MSSPLIARCHENSVEAYRVFARTTPGGIIVERSGLVLVNAQASDSMGNLAIVTAPATDGASVIAEAEAFFARDPRPWALFAFPEAIRSLERAARDRGLRDEGRFAGLALDPLPREVPPVPDGVEVRRVGTVAELQTFERTASAAYEVPSGPVHASWLRYPGFSFHLAYRRGEPVATATLVVSHGIAGIVYVGTVPAARGQGLGRAVVWAAIAAGREQGCRTSALWASPQGRPMYEKMGFRPITEYGIWTPPEYPLPPAFWPLEVLPRRPVTR
ncbi:MAG: GNAT family N-acetyltransferase [Thermoplasmata archaeon]|nr:GNAT family N-acetyltransferase [Thermoplasmata archaeon]